MALALTAHHAVRCNSGVVAPTALPLSEDDLEPKVELGLVYLSSLRNGFSRAEGTGALRDKRIMAAMVNTKGIMRKN